MWKKNFSPVFYAIDGKTVVGIEDIIRLKVVEAVSCSVSRIALLSVYLLIHRQKGE
jgi:hypothetical protein